MLDRVIADPNTTKTQKHAASTIKWIYQSYGVMPLDRKGAGGKKGVSPLRAIGRDAGVEQFQALQ
jgi:hypothetical protein